MPDSIGSLVGSGSDGESITSTENHTTTTELFAKSSPSRQPDGSSTGGGSSGGSTTTTTTTTTVDNCADTANWSNPAHARGWDGRGIESSVDGLVFSSKFCSANLARVERADGNEYRLWTRKDCEYTDFETK
jgi:hypothetical protein